VRTALFNDGHTVVPEGALVNVDGRRVRIRGALQADGDVGATAERGADRASGQAQRLE